MRHSAPDAQRHLAIAKRLGGGNARLVETDIDALETGSAISRFEALTATWAAMRPRACGLDSRRYLGLRQRSQCPGVDLCIKAGGLDLHQDAGSGKTAVAGNRAKRPTSRRDGVAPDAPITAQGDGKAATLVMCHGRPLLLVDGRGFDAGDLAAVSVYPALNVAGHVNAVGVAASAVAIEFHGLGFGFCEPDVVAGACVVCARHYFGDAAIVHGDFGAGGNGLGHFGLLPLISRGAEGKQPASHKLYYTHETKERKNFLQLFFGGRCHQAKPSNA